MTTSIEREDGSVAVGSVDELASRRAFLPTAKLSGTLAVIGLICAAFAVAILAGPGRTDGTRKPAPIVAAPTALHVDGTSSYLPGQSSGWHSHPGLHLVIVLKGTLTMYDGNCNAATFTPGQRYVGGETVHLARNEGGSVLDMAVTYMPREGASMTDFRIDEAAPPGCPLS